MAAVVKTHVRISGDDAKPQFEDGDDLSDSDVGSNEEASDGGEDDGDGSRGSSGEEAENEEGGEDEDGDDGNANAGWAEAMAKILGKKTPENQSSILVDKKRAWEMMCREKPDLVKDRESERALQRIATRGVVQLFNAVRKHQKTIDDKVKEVGGSERKKAKLLSSVSKKDFIDVLRRTEGGGGVSVKMEKDVAGAAAEKPAWSVLRDDFMMGATMKDWDKDSDGEEPNTHSGGKAEESHSD
ncbi:RRP15-like protein [Dicentrarchus labrax]|uniref:RRP15-like protein n=1 Tax=Dicentrarchus labrax TaxID=13489 RepID=UPI0021F614DC|nr:RRP15-like protein [Dicentrarchus labrax]